MRACNKIDHSFSGSVFYLQGRLSAGIVGNIVNLQAQEIAQAAERYAELQAKLEVSIQLAVCIICLQNFVCLCELLGK
jgi:hypothetical protein